MTLHTFLDVDRLRNETDRRFHASDIQRVDGAVQVVPSAAFKLAPRVTPRAWGRNEQHLGILATEAIEQGNTLEWIGIQRERWGKPPMAQSPRALRRTRAQPRTA